MPRTKYEDGTRWGQKEVLRRGVNNLQGWPTYYWRCLGCGQEYGPSTSRVFRSARTQCCPARGMEKVNYYGYYKISGRYMARLKDRAKKRGLAYKLTAELLWEIWIAQEGRCAYTGRILEHGFDASLDRIDSLGGYVVDNVQWVHKDVNKIKWDLTDQAFLAVCREVVEYAKERKR